MAIPVDQDALTRLVAGVHRRGRMTVRRVAFLDALLGLHRAVRGVVDLGQRLDERLHPQFREQPLEAPVYIVAAPRSGTTLMHRLMSTDPRFTAFRLYETLLPSIALCRGIERMRRSGGALQSLASRVIARVDDASFGGWDGVHATGLDAPEEDEGLWVLAMASPSLWMGTPYADAVRTTLYVDRQPQARRDALTRYYRDALKRHAFLHPGRTLLMKTVLIPGRFETVSRAVPDARFIYLVRNPCEVIPSMLSLFTIPWHAHSPEVPLDGEEVAALTELAFDYVRLLHRIHLERAAVGKPFHTVRYDELVADPVGAVRGAYGGIGLSLEPAVESRIAQLVSQQRGHRQGQHYSLEKFGLDRARVRDALPEVFEYHGFEA